MIRKILLYGIVYLMLVLFILIGIRLFIVSQSSFRAFWGAVYAQEDYQRGLQVRAVEKLFTIGVGGFLFIFWMVAEELFRRAVAKHLLLQRLGEFFGIELLLLFVADFVLKVVGGVNLADWAGWLPILLELIFGSALLYLAVRLARARVQPTYQFLEKPGSV